MRGLAVPFHRLSGLARTMEIVTTIGIALIVILSVACFLIPTSWTQFLLLAKFGQVGET